MHPPLQLTLVPTLRVGMPCATGSASESLVVAWCPDRATRGAEGDLRSKQVRGRETRAQPNRVSERRGHVRCKWEKFIGGQIPESPALATLIVAGCGCIGSTCAFWGGADLSELSESEGGKEGSGFRVQGSGFGVQGSGFGVQGSGFRVQGSGFRVQGSGFRARYWLIPARRDKPGR